MHCLYFCLTLREPILLAGVRLFSSSSATEWHFRKMGDICISGELNQLGSNRQCKSCSSCKDMERFIRPMVLEMHKCGVNGISFCPLREIRCQRCFVYGVGELQLRLCQAA